MASMLLSRLVPSAGFFVSTVSATTRTSTLSLHDALPIWITVHERAACYFDFVSRFYRSRLPAASDEVRGGIHFEVPEIGADRKSTRLNSSHRCISYAVFCLKKKNIFNMVVVALFLTLSIL